MKQAQDKVRELKVSCPNCGGEDIWAHEYIYTRQHITFHPFGTVNIRDGSPDEWPFDIEWQDETESVYECTQEYEINGIKLPFTCRHCYEDLRADELVIRDPAHEQMMYEVNDLLDRCGES
jgi:hypothetical protein